MAGLFPPQERDWNLPTEGELTPRAAARVAREAATGAFDQGAREINIDWSTGYDGKQIERWGEAMGRTLLERRGRELERLGHNRRPVCRDNEHQLLVIGMDGGRVQMREKNTETGSRWKEDKVLTVSSCLRGDGDKKPPKKLLTTTLATMAGSRDFGMMARLETERRGIRNAVEALVIGDGGPWIDSICEKHFPHLRRIIDYYHAAEYLHEAAKAAHTQRPAPAVPAICQPALAPSDPQSSDASRQASSTPAPAPAACAPDEALAERLTTLLWEGQLPPLLAELEALSQRAGPPQADDDTKHPRRVLAVALGYFQRHGHQMDYPAYRARGWPIGSGIIESGVKRFGKRLKGTEQFWGQEGAEAILALRGKWLSEDAESQHYWLGYTSDRLAA